MYGIELKDTSRAAHLFSGWQETMIWSCLQKVMGSILVDNEDDPASAAACLGGFVFFAGEPDEKLLKSRPASCFIMVPQNDAWAHLIEQTYPEAQRQIRYAFRKDGEFDAPYLESLVSKLPEGYEIRSIDEDIYHELEQIPLMNDFVGCFRDCRDFMDNGLGFVIVKDGKTVSGASSYTRYQDGIEIEVDTITRERGKGLAAIACSALILECLKRGLYPSWDAQNPVSRHLAETLGYHFSHKYPVYCIPEEQKK